MVWKEDTVLFAVSLLLAFAAGLICDFALYRYFIPRQGGILRRSPVSHASFSLYCCKRQRRLPAATIVAVAMTVAFLLMYGFSVFTLRCILLCQVLAMAGVVDQRTWEIPDIFHLLIFMVGLVGFRPLPALCGLFLVPLPLFVAAWKTGKIGGGDVKLMAASGFALGVSAGMRMTVWGLAAGLLCNAIFHKGRGSFPLAPFLAFGCFMALLPL